MKMPGGGPDPNPPEGFPRSRMRFQVLVNFDDRKNKPLYVADREDEFEKTTVLELKKKLREQIPGAPRDPNQLWVIFGREPLEDDHTLGSYNIKHLSVLLIVMKMPAGPDPNPPEGFPRSRMRFQVLVNFDDRKNKPLYVADREDEFEKTTVLELKKKLREQIPGAPRDPEDVRVIFGTEQLEDHRTLGFYRITHLSVLLFVLRMPAGGDPNPVKDFPDLNPWKE